MSQSSDNRATTPGDNLDQSDRTFLAELGARGETIRFQKPVHPTKNLSAVEWKTYA
jgi:hypothetical protein